MRLLGLVLCAGLLSAAAAVNSGSNSFIVGGQDAAIGQFVHQGFIQSYNRDYVCGGWIHSYKWVVAPAYYMYERSIADTFVVLGSVSTTSGGIQYPVDQKYIHPNYNYNTLDNNIALLYIEGGLQWFPHVHPVPLSAEYTRGNVIASVAGWARNQVWILDFCVK